MNRDRLLRGIFWVALVTGFVCLIMASYVIYTRQVDKIELLKKNLEETHQILKEVKDELGQVKARASTLAAKKDNLIEELSLQEDSIGKLHQEKAKLQSATQDLAAQKMDLKADLKNTRNSLEARIKEQELTIAKLEDDFQKKSAMENALFKAQMEKSNEQILAAEVLLEALTRTNKELQLKASENKQMLVRLIEEEVVTPGEEIEYQAKKAANEASLKAKIDNLNAMIERNKKLIAKNEKVIIDVTSEKEKIADKLKQTKEQFDAEALKLHYNLGLAYDESRQYDEALSEYGKALAVDSSDPDLHYNIAIIYEGHFHNTAKAIEHYKAYLALAPNAEDADKVALWLEKAQHELQYSPSKHKGAQPFYDVIMKDEEDKGKK